MAAAPADAAAVSVTHAGTVARIGAALVALGSEVGAQHAALPLGLRPGHHAVSVRPEGSVTVWNPTDTGTYPLLMLVSDGGTTLDTVLPRYLATHGYVVAAVGRATDGEVARMTDTLRVGPFVDSSRVAVAALRRDALEIRVRDKRLRVTVPGSARRLRMLCAVTHAILDAALRGLRPTIPTLAARLRAAGFTTEITPTP